jgi:hypothetical protein
MSKWGTRRHRAEVLVLAAWLVIPFLAVFRAGMAQEGERLLAGQTPSEFVVAVGIVALATGYVVMSQRIALNTVGVPWIMFLLWASVGSFWSLEPYASMKFAISIAVVVACVSQMEAQALTRALVIAGLAVWLLIATMILHVGFAGRSIGSVPPNVIAQSGVAAAIALFPGTRSRLFRTGAIFAAVSLSLASDSRGATLTLLVFVFVYVTLLSSRPVFFAACAGAVLAALLGVGTITSVVDPLAQASGLLSLDDADRGVGTGFTGRSDRWEAGLASVGDPLAGFGADTRGPFSERIVRNDETNAHSGWINLYLDMGLVGLAVFIWLLASAVLRSKAPHRGYDPWTTAVLASFVIPLIFESQYMTATAAYYQVVLIALIAAPKTQPSVGQGVKARATVQLDKRRQQTKQGFDRRAAN